MDDITLSEHPEVFSEWEPEIDYKLNNIRVHDKKLYRCIQEHTSHIGWEPNNTPALWKLTSDPQEEFPEWSQPIGATDAYDKGDKVSWKEKHWVSTADANVWEPGVYGWETTD